MITEIKLVNFKGHQSTQLSLDDSRLHALVGKNSSGKTSVLQALSYFSRLTNESLEGIFKNKHSPEFLITVGQKSMNVTTDNFRNDNGKVWRASYCESIVSDRSSVVWEEYIHKDFPIPRLEKTDSLRDAPLLIRQSLKNMIYLKLIANNLAQADYSEEVRPSIHFNGSRLAPTLDYIRNEAPTRFQELQEMLKRIVPGVRKIRIQRAKVEVNHHRSISIDGKEIAYGENQERIGQEIVFDMNTGDRIPAHGISEGTILALGLLTVLMNLNQPKLVLLDDIEQGLHPRAQRELIAIFKEIIQTNPDLQIIFTTHSPYILDDLDFSQVHVLNTTSSGLTFCKRLDEHPDVEWAKQTLTTGEFWDAEEESWVTGEEILAENTRN